MAEYKLNMKSISTQNQVPFQCLDAYDQKSISENSDDDMVFIDGVFIKNCTFPPSKLRNMYTMGGENIQISLNETLCGFWVIDVND